MAVQKTAQTVVMMTAAPAVSSAELNMQQRILSLSPAPKYFASGIPKPQQERIFERFYRVDKRHSKEVGGTGLGLSIVKHGAAYLGAGVSVHSEPGQGSEFILAWRGKK